MSSQNTQNSRQEGEQKQQKQQQQRQQLQQKEESQQKEQSQQKQEQPQKAAGSGCTDTGLFSLLATADHLLSDRQDFSIEDMPELEPERVKNLIDLYNKYRTRLDTIWKESTLTAKVHIKINPRVSTLFEGDGYSSHELLCRGIKLRVKAWRKHDARGDVMVFELFRARPWVGITADVKATLHAPDSVGKSMSVEKRIECETGPRKSDADGYLDDILHKDWKEFLDDNVFNNGRLRFEVEVSIVKIVHPDKTIWDLDSTRPYIRFPYLENLA
jgi:hypothetical protein